MDRVIFYLNHNISETESTQKFLGTFGFNSLYHLINFEEISTTFPQPPPYSLDPSTTAANVFISISHAIKIYYKCISRRLKSNNLNISDCLTYLIVYISRNRKSKYNLTQKISWKFCRIKSKISSILNTSHQTTLPKINLTLNLKHEPLFYVINTNII